MKSNWFRSLLVIIVTLAVAFALTQSNAADKKRPAKPAAKQLPRLLDLGSTKCIPCRMMAPILDELAEEYKGQLTVDFIDVWKDQKAAEKYKIKSIPTQIFFDAKGKEFSRYVGFFPKEDILKTFEKQGIKFKKSEEPKKPKGKK